MTNKRLKEMLTAEEQAKVNLYTQKLDNAKTWFTAKYYGWRARTILDKAILRIRQESKEEKKNKALSHA